MKKKVVIATHGKLAEGFMSALQLIVGPQEIEAICCYETPDFQMDEEVERILGTVGEEDELIVFTDLLGGSVNNAFMKKLYNRSFHLITNTSLALLMDYLLSSSSVKELVQKMDAGEFNAVYCNKLMSLAGNEIEDDL